MCGWTFNRFFTDDRPDVTAAGRHLGAVFHAVHSSAWPTLIKSNPINPFLLRPSLRVALPWPNTGWHLGPNARIFKCVAFTFNGTRLEKSLRHLRTRLSKSRAVFQCSCERPMSVLVGLDASWLPNCHAAVCPSAGIGFPGGKCVWAALGEHQKKAAVRRGGHLAYRRVFVCREAHVKCKSRQSCLTSEEETWTSFCPRRFCSEDCTRTDYSCVRFPPTSHLARKAARGVGWLPAKVKGCVDGVVILKTCFFFLLVFVCFSFILPTSLVPSRRFCGDSRVPAVFSFHNCRCWQPECICSKWFWPAYLKAFFNKIWMGNGKLGFTERGH